MRKNLVAKALPTGIVRAIVAVTGVKDEVDDIILPGAFARTLRLRRPKVVFHHSWEKFLGKTLHIEELLPGDRRLPKLTKDGKAWPAAAGALVATMQMNMRVQAGRDAYEWVVFYGNECEFSVGYRVVPTKTSKGKDGIRYIGDLDVYELSLVLWGAHPMTMTLETKDGGDLQHKTLPGFAMGAEIMGAAAAAVMEAKSLPVEMKAAARAVHEAKALTADDHGRVREPGGRSGSTPGTGPRATKRPSSRAPGTGPKTASGRPSRAQDPSFKEELHPRAPLGQPNGGQFVAKGDGYKSTGKADRADDVRAAQSALIREGDLGSDAGRGGRGDDGLFGAKTEAAVKAWQKRNGFQPTGKLTREQHAKLTGGSRGRKTQRDQHGRTITPGRRNAPVGVVTGRKKRGNPRPAPGAGPGQPAPRKRPAPKGPDRAGRPPGHPDYGSDPGFDRDGKPYPKRKITAPRHKQTEGKSAWDTVMEAKVLPPEGATDTCPCGTPAVFDVDNGWQHADGSVSHDHTVQTVSDLMGPLETKAAGPKYAGLAVIAADTGRVLMLQRALTVNDPAAGCWEFPGGGLDAAEKPYDGAVREWEEETGLSLPHGNQAGHWDTGPYRLHAYVVPIERDVRLNVDHEDRDVTNPDDPNGSQPEVVAWWDLRALAGTRSTAIRAEVRRNTDWAALAAAAGGAVARKLEKKHLTDMERKGMEQMAGSFEALREQLGVAVRDLLCKGSDETWACVEATMTDHVIASCHRDGKQTTFQIPFTHTPDGVQLGEPQEVTLSVVAVPADGETTEPATAEEEAQVRFTAPAGSMLDDAAQLLMVAPLEGKALDDLQGPLLRLLDALAAKGLDVAAAILGDDDEDEPVEPEEGLTYDGVEPDSEDEPAVPLEEKVLLDPDDIAADIASLQEDLAA